MTAPDVVHPACLAPMPRTSPEDYCRRHVRGRACMFRRDHQGRCLPAPSRPARTHQETP